MILSASVTLEARERAAKAGADEFVSKPFDAASLVHQIDRLGERVTQVQKRGSKTVARLKLARGTRHNAEPTGQAITGLLGETSRLAVDPTLLDRSRLAQLEDIARDPAFLAELIGGFTSDVDTILSRTTDAISNDTLNEIPDLMHSLKGAAVGVGATRLATLASELDRLAPQLGRDAIEAKADEIQSCFEATAISLQQYLRAQPHASPH